MDLRFDLYLKKLANVYRDGGTEHTGRMPLENLLDVFAKEATAPGITVQQEPKRDRDRGAPDFKIQRQGMILGYIEVKEIGENLDRVLKSEQIAKYRKLSDNIIVTDYLQFVRIDGRGKVLQRESLAFASDLEGRAVRVNKDRAEAVSKILSAFFSSPPEGLRRARQLASALATRSKMLRDFLAEELTRQSKARKKGRLHDLFQVFRERVFHELTTKEFADAFAQMLSYGLFLAKLNAGDDDRIKLDNVRNFIPGSFGLIRELVRFLEEMKEAEYDEVKWVIDEILSIVNGLAIENIREDLSFRRRGATGREARAGDGEEQRLFERDPFIYFYEDFLKAYDKETRKGRGVYYTPPPVVNFIVRAVDDILKDRFDIADGLADHKRVTVLDFAAGTGTFLLEAMQRIFDNIGGPEAGKAEAVVREHMLRNLYGFEYLIAPYTIAHLKLSQYLKDKGHPLRDDERLQVYLTNTLEPVEPQKSAFLPELSHEVEAAQEVKEKPILVILGNPPYSGHSKNKGAWITSAIDGYKYTVERTETGRDGDDMPIYSEEKKPLGERNPKWLNDDYVKFIRFAQLKMDAVDEGIVGVITNHSWLDNPTFRGMRQSLMRSFDQIYVLDLHGNAKKREKTPDGGKDENVFDIEQGVAISLFVKKPGIEKGVWRGDLWGTRLNKYQDLTIGNRSFFTENLEQPQEPVFLFLKQNHGLWKIFEQGIPIKEIFSAGVLGFQSHRDRFAISFSENEMRNKLSVFSDRSLSDAEIEAIFGIKTNRDWSLTDARENLIRQGARSISKISYRPFDLRFSEFSEITMDYPRRELLENVFQRENYCLNVVRQTKQSEWKQVLISNYPSPAVYVEIKDGSTVFPLWTYETEGLRRENLSPAFRDYLDARYDHHYSPEEILGYIYAVLHAPAYRKKYAEFLRLDFPRIPFAEEAEHFEALSQLGWALVRAHLMRDLPRTGFGELQGRGDCMVEHVRRSEEDRRVSINEAQGFAPVPEDVWNFHIGGYRVLDKYLKSRKGRKHFSPQGRDAGRPYPLTLDEVTHIGRICDALSFTVRRMEEIDTAYAQAFPDRG